MSETMSHPAHHQPAGRNDGLEVLDRVQWPALAVGGVAGALLLLGLLVSGRAVLHSYLYAYIFWAGISLGCFALLMLQHLTGGMWGLVIRRVLEGGSRLLPLVALLFVPVAISVLVHSDALYPWLNENEHLPGFKGVYLQPAFFIGRSVAYFLVWIALATLLNRWSAQQDQGADRLLRMQRLSAPGLILYVLTMSLAATDWVMSLDPHWYSTIYGFLFIIGQVLSTMALAIALLVLLAGREPLSRLMNPGLYNDLGNLLMAFVMLWAYISFSQFLIIWSANTAEEAPYYVHRTSGAWGAIALCLVFLHFAVPFVLLLWRRSKRNPRALAAIALGLLAMRFVDLYWLIKPSLTGRVAGTTSHGMSHDVPPLVSGWMDLPLTIAAPAAIGGIFIFALIRELKRRPIVPVGDPRLAELEARGAHHG